MTVAISPAAERAKWTILESEALADVRIWQGAHRRAHVRATLALSRCDLHRACRAQRAQARAHLEVRAAWLHLTEIRAALAE